MVALFSGILDVVSRMSACTARVCCVEVIEVSCPVFHSVPHRARVLVLASSTHTKRSAYIPLHLRERSTLVFSIRL